MDYSVCTLLRAMHALTFVEMGSVLVDDRLLPPLADDTHLKRGEGVTDP